MTWAAIGAAGISAGAGYLSSSSRKSTPGSAGQMIMAPQWRGTEDMFNAMQSSVTDTISRHEQGLAPRSFDKYAPYLRQNLERGVQTTYYGRPGDRTGSIQAAHEAGAQSGTGSKPGTANVNRVLQRYEEASLGIDEEIEKFRFETTQREYGTAMMAGIQMPQGPKYEKLGG